MGKVMARRLRARSSNLSKYDSDYLGYSIVNKITDRDIEKTENKNEDEIARKIEELWKEWQEIKLWLESSKRVLDELERRFHGLNIKIAKILKKVRRDIEDVRKLNNRAEKLLEITEKEIKPITEWIKKRRNLRSAIEKIRKCIKERIIVKTVKYEDEVETSTEEFLEMLRKVKKEIETLKYDKEKKIVIRFASRYIWIDIVKKIAKICIELENLSNVIKLKDYFESETNTDVLFELLTSKKHLEEITIDDVIDIVMQEIYLENLP